ncbi:MAG: HIT domain-containing protein [Chloroflexales bacterium]|nr:HIT domain-containing protein [Chloroflexales bacterium]
METKFTPWRMRYIRRDDGPDEGGCVFCGMTEEPPDHDTESLILARGERCFVVLNLFPYNTAHTMVVPYAHTADLVGLDAITAAELFALTRRCVAVISDEYHPQGFNLGMNLGSTAGAGIAEHLHMHIVPRWNGDTNFMPIIGQTKLIPEELDETYGRLRARFKAPALC